MTPTVPFTQAPLKAQIVAVIDVLIVIGLGVRIVRGFWKSIVQDDSWQK